MVYRKTIQILKETTGRRTQATNFALETFSFSCSSPKFPHGGARKQGRDDADVERRLAPGWGAQSGWGGEGGWVARVGCRECARGV